MAIVQADILFRLSGGAANSNPTLSLGGAISSTAAGTDIFDNVSSVEAESGDTEYRCIYVKNNHGTLTLTNAKVWFASSNGSGGAYAGDDIYVGVGTSAIGGVEQDVTTFSPIGTEGTAPVGVSFYAGLSEVAALALGNITAGSHKAIWIRRVISAGAAAFSNAGFTLRVKGDTAA